MLKRMASVAAGKAVRPKVQLKVELHCHLDGSIRCTTLYELAKKHKSPYGDKPFEEFKKYVTYTEIGNLPKFLKTFEIFLPWVLGDKEVLRRIAYELCEDKANEGVAYIEARYCPHLLATDKVPELNRTGDMNPREVVECINEGLRQGSKDHGIVAKSILCCYRGFPAWSKDIVELCKEFHNDPVVGIDLAGDEQNIPICQQDIDAFMEAKRCGIHRTVHAGESGPAANVKEAVDRMAAERIGHGYHVFEDEELYQRLRKEGIHFEVCPMSSYYLSTMGTDDWKKHPAVRLAADDVSFSLNTDDDSVFQTSVPNEFKVAYEKMGLSVPQLAKVLCNAARASFLPEEEKKELMKAFPNVHDQKESALKSLVLANSGCNDAAQVCSSE